MNSKPDLRNALAKARDKFMESDSGQRLYADEARGVYLRNRIEAAFIDGWMAAKKDSEKAKADPNLGG